MAAINQDLISNARRIYFIGIGGVGMSAIARVLKYRGFDVAGSDIRETRHVRDLVGLGIPVTLTAPDPLLDQSDLVIYSSAISRADWHLVRARELGIRICHRAEVLASILNQAETSVGVLGTHGKTTTTSMISYALVRLGRDPNCLVGGDIADFGTNALMGASDLWAAEVDESDRSHELYALNYAILTNLEQDHMENYKGLEDLKGSFEKFVSQTRNPGLITYFGEDPLLNDIVKQSGKPHVTYGFSPVFDFSAVNVTPTAFGSEFDLLEAGFPVVRVSLKIPGRHNVANALAVIATLVQMGFDLEEIVRALGSFNGARRRLEVKAGHNGVIVIDDYAHHPTEVRAVLNTLGKMGCRLTVIFQPHRFSRTAFFYQEFAQALSAADEVVITEIYSAGEADPGGVDAKLIYNELIHLGHENVTVVMKNDVLGYLQTLPSCERIVAFLGAGNITEVADEFACRIKTAASA